MRLECRDEGNRQDEKLEQAEVLNLLSGKKSRNESEISEDAKQFPKDVPAKADGCKYG